MENYKLGREEVVLYKGDVIYNKNKGATELILTNINLVFITKYKKLFSSEEVTVDTYPLEEIKIYEEIPQIKTKGNNVEIYFLDFELEFMFSSKIEMHKFTAAANKLLTGKTAVEKGAKKVKETIGIVDDTLGINTVEVTSSVIKNGIMGSITGTIGGIAKSLFKKK